MQNAEHPVRVYEDLAEWYERNAQAKLRDWFLVLAADAALSAGQAEEAERLRGRLLQANPHHLLKPFTSFAEALQSPDVEGYVADLRRTYPPEAAANLLHSQQKPAGRAAQEARVPALPQVAGRPPAGEAAPAPGPSVFRLKPTAEEPRPNTGVPRPAPPPRAPARPEGPPAAPPRPRPPQSAPAPRVPALTPLPRPAVSHPRRSQPESEDEDTATGAWVASSLFVLVLASGAALALYTLARPFLPPGWLR